MGFEKEQEGPQQQQSNKETLLLRPLEVSDNISSQEVHKMISRQSDRLLQLFKSVGVLLGRGGVKNRVDGKQDPQQHILLESLVDAFCRR